jgi:hypothetical protein
MSTVGNYFNLDFKCGVCVKILSLLCVPKTDVVAVADPPVGDPATATPLKMFFSFFPTRNEKNELRKPFFGHDRHPLTDFLDPPLQISTTFC